jgi:hypothetical protein
VDAEEMHGFCFSSPSLLPKRPIGDRLSLSRQRMRLARYCAPCAAIAVVSHCQGCCHIARDGCGSASAEILCQLGVVGSDIVEVILETARSGQRLILRDARCRAEPQDQRRAVGGADRLARTERVRRSICRGDRTRPLALTRRLPVAGGLAVTRRLPETGRNLLAAPGGLLESSRLTRELCGVAEPGGSGGWLMSRVRHFCATHCRSQSGGRA